MRGVLMALAALVVLALAGCGDEPSEAQESGASSVTLAFADGAAPAPERMKASVGEEIEIVVKSDEPGELHVHTEPEEELEYSSGTTTLTLTIDQPGVYEVESHELETTVLQLEVS